ncbi:MAG: hypothetical protein IH939_10665 [Acidobacteria bacterium]|nr:hypothetical protein [Acidobacteriota bacterium]
MTDVVDTAPDRNRGTFGRWLVDPGALAAALILILGGWAALSVDAVQTGGGIKGDEATYVAMAFSAAYDRDLEYERRDLERFFRTYNGGPEGIFLKRGRDLYLEFRVGWPPIAIGSDPDRRTDRLFFGKAFIYPVMVAPLVWLAGLNGMLLFHVMLLAGVVFAGYRFAAARSPAAPALVYVLGFLGASIVPLYVVWLSSEIFNFSLVFFAYFAWFYKEVAPRPVAASGWWRQGSRADALGAVLLGLATFSKPYHALLIVPPVLWYWHRRRWADGARVAVVFGLVAAGGYGVTALVSGELNYQGGERRTYYGEFPFDGPDAGFADRGIVVSTNDLSLEEAPASTEFVGLLARNVWYFFVGRHFGFVPFFFPGVVVVIWALWRRPELRAWHLLILATAAATAVVLLVITPYSWSGGGGPSGNRYYMSVYPVLFFVAPPLRSLGPSLIAWLGGAVFTAQILINPFVSAKHPYLSVQRGAFRWLPVELTMVNDLPIMLDPARSRVVYQVDPTVLLYFLDDEAYLPEPPGIWIAGHSHAHVIVRTDGPLTALTVTLSAPIDNDVTVRIGGSEATVHVQAGVPTQVTLTPRGVFSRQSWAYLLSVTTRDGFVPRLRDPNSTDPRYLGVALQLTPTVDARR